MANPHSNLRANANAWVSTFEEYRKTIATRIKYNKPLDIAVSLDINIWKIPTDIATEEIPPTTNIFMKYRLGLSNFARKKTFHESGLLRNMGTKFAALQKKRTGAKSSDERKSIPCKGSQF
jgi:hypothetical protein